MLGQEGSKNKQFGSELF